MTSSKVLSGLDTAARVYETFNDRIKVLSTKGVVPGLCVVLVGEHPASQIYVRTKSKKLKSPYRVMFGSFGLFIAVLFGIFVKCNDEQFS